MLLTLHPARRAQASSITAQYHRRTVSRASTSPTLHPASFSILILAAVVASSAPAPAPRARDRMAMMMTMVMAMGSD
jgi:hypothetical protein